jgi:2-keto-4-pentenoate hydratase/2-oxohepta-3-ene-1,7-dioic acid hydratase in catechol pathway
MIAAIRAMPSPYLITGRTGRNILEEQAMDYVFGYAAYNDTAVHEIHHWPGGAPAGFKGKSLGGHGPMGP